MVKEIPLTQGKVALVDDEDYEQLMKYKWHACNYINTFYAKRNVYPKSPVFMHRVIMNAQPGEQVDHINNNGLDNRKCNLRITTQSQNLMNARKRPNCTSSYKGVYWCKEINQWIAKIKTKEERLNLGRFDNEIDAARAYDEAAKKLFGEYAKLNIMELNEK